MKPKLIILTGPTAVGKSNLSLKLAKEINAEIVSADSMQVYRRMDVGSAKLTKAEMGDIRHHLIDILEPTQAFNVYLFQQYAKEAIQDIYNRGKIPLIVGGTGFYIQALLYDIDFSEDEETDSAYRAALEKEASVIGNHALHEKLRDIDPITYDTIHENDLKRVIRALEYYHDTGEPISKHNTEMHQKDSPYDFYYFVLTDEREVLYRRIDERVDVMIENGLVQEVQSLMQEGLDKSYISMKGLGYKEIIDYLNGLIPLDEAIRIIKRDTRHFAKRQLTWFRREKEVEFINKQDFNCSDDEILQYILQRIGEKDE